MTVRNTRFKPYAVAVLPMLWLRITKQNLRGCSPSWPAHVMKTRAYADKSHTISTRLTYNSNGIKIMPMTSRS